MRRGDDHDEGEDDDEDGDDAGRFNRYAPRCHAKLLQ